MNALLQRPEVYGDTLEHENHEETYDVYNTARRHIQARR